MYGELGFHPTLASGQESLRVSGTHFYRLSAIATNSIKALKETAG